ncbi:MAG: hypothetical protein QM680_07655 [Luteolibacter sp.]
MAKLLASAGSGAFVSLEVIDDVAVHGADGFVEMVQSKSALTANPIADRAIPLWKTLSNWASDLGPQVEFEKLALVMAVANPRDGAMAEMFNASRTLENAEAALAKVRETFAEELAAPDTGKKDIGFFLKRFFGVDELRQREIIRCFTLETAEVSPQVDFPKWFPFIPEAQLEDVIKQAQGWVKREAELLMEKGKPAILSRDDFHREMTAFIRKYRERAILRSFAPATVSKDKTDELMPKLFVRQLEVIDAEFSDRLQAVSDYFRAACDRTHWGETAEIHPSSFDEFDDNLERAWLNLRRRCSLQNKGLDEAELGRVLYSSCCDHSATLEGQEVPNHFVPGTFHLLAEKPKIGWHPRFAEVLANETPSPSA